MTILLHGAAVWYDGVFSFTVLQCVITVVSIVHYCKV